VAFGGGTLIYFLCQGACVHRCIWIEIDGVASDGGDKSSTPGLVPQREW
jgi:hypothetical protein